MDRRRPTTILLLDGRDDRRAEYCNVLSANDLKVIAVADSQAALVAIRAINPRVIVANMDAESRNDRLDFCRQVKGDPRTNDIPVLLTSESLKEQDVALATDPGVLVLTMSPEDVAKLVGALNGVLAAQRAQPPSASGRRRREAQRPA